MSPKQIAIEIYRQTEAGKEAKAEFQKMMGRSIEEASKEQKEIGLACLSAFCDKKIEQWREF